MVTSNEAAPIEIVCSSALEVPGMARTASSKLSLAFQDAHALESEDDLVEVNKLTHKLQCIVNARYPDCLVNWHLITSGFGASIALAEKLAPIADSVTVMAVCMKEQDLLMRTNALAPGTDIVLYSNAAQNRRFSGEVLAATLASRLTLRVSEFVMQLTARPRIRASGCLPPETSLRACKRVPVDSLPEDLRMCRRTSGECQQILSPHRRSNSDYGAAT
jgi:hypothetical protein